MVCPRRCHCLTSIASPLSTLQRQKRKLLNPPLICFITEPWLSLFSTGSSEKGEGGFRGGLALSTGHAAWGEEEGDFPSSLHIYAPPSSPENCRQWRCHVHSKGFNCYKRCRCNVMEWWLRLAEWWLWLKIIIMTNTIFANTDIPANNLPCYHIRTDHTPYLSCL